MSDLFLTWPEIHLLSRKLTNLRDWMVDDLDSAIARQVAFGDDNDIRRRGRDDSGLEFNAAASLVAQDLWGVLRAWTEHVCTHSNHTWPGNQRSHVYAGWLNRRRVDLAKTEEAPQALDEICDAWDRVKRAIDLPPPLEFAGTCQSDLPGVRCEGVYVRPGTLEKKCSTCHVMCDIQKMRAAIREELEGLLYSAPELATAMSIKLENKVPFERVRNWVRRGRLTAAATKNGEGMFRLTDALELYERNSSKPSRTAS